MRVQSRTTKLVMAAGLWLLSYTSYSQFPMAAHLVLNGDYDGARAYYLKVLEKDSLNFNANQELGLLLVQYYDNKTEALFYINRAMRAVKKKDLITELYLAYAQALHYNSQYQEAIPYYEKIIPTLADKDKGAQLKKQMLLCIENCKYGIKNASKKNSQKAAVRNLGANINTAYPEFIPVNDAENTTLFYTTKRNLALGDKKDGEDNSHGAMFIAQNITGKFEIGMPFYKPSFPLKFMEGTQELDAVVGMSANGEHLLICRNDLLFVSDLSEGKWTPALRLPATINITPRYEGSACISNDGKTIYFTANKPGGFGGKDLYKSVKTANGDWTEGENLGEDINTAEDEDSPFLNFSETALYYSSKGLDGFGGFDIYKAKVTAQGLGKPANVGQPLNSPADDIYFTMNQAESEGYLASSRKGGYGDLDLYHILFFDKPLGKNCIATTSAKPSDDVYLDLNFPDSVFVDHLVNFAAMGSHVKGGTILNYFWKVNDTLQTGDTSTFAKKFNRPSRYNVTLQAAVYLESEGLRRDYCVNKELHVFNPQAVDVFFEPLVKANEDKLAIKGTADVAAVKLDTSKKQLLSIKLEPVFFNTDKADLRKDAQEAIKRNVAKMKVDGAIVVKLTALTDSRANKEYNLKLAQKRANSVVAALEKGGIKRKRILAVLALGEEEADLKKCNGEAVCLEKAYQHNRRVEFKVMGAEYLAKSQVLAKKGVKKTTKKK